MSEKEDIPISSPIVLVSKRNKLKPGVEPGSREASLSMYCFCVDFRYLNSQTQDFCYTIPDVQELNESFTQRTPNFISTIDMSSGFFQMKVSSQASKYTAFNTCFGTYKFLRLPQGLKISPNSFQMLMDKILSGLSFRSTLCYLDDVLIFSETFDQHLSDLQEVLTDFVPVVYVSLQQNVGLGVLAVYFLAMKCQKKVSNHLQIVSKQFLSIQCQLILDN